MQQYNDLTGSKRPSTPYSRKLVSFFLEERDRMFFEVTKEVQTSSGLSQDSSNICFRVKSWSVVRRAPKKIGHHPTYIQLFLCILFQSTWHALF